MARIPDAFIDDLLARTDIVEVIGTRVPLKRQGKEFAARCPSTTNVRRASPSRRPSSSTTASAAGRTAPRSRS
jgi:hypothetical protein